MTAREQLNKCITRKNELAAFINYNTFIGPKIKSLIDEITILISLLPEHFDEIKMFLEDDIKKLPNNGRINAFTFGRLQRDLDCLDCMIPHVTSRKIFISHSSKDEKIVNEFCDMLCLGVGFDKGKDIFCTSIDGMKITNGEDIRKHIQANVNYSDFAILLISDNYKKSEVCINEMGAVWAIDKKVKTYVFPNMKESEVGWLINTKAAEKINDTTALASLYDELTDFYKKPKNTTLWTAQANKFCSTFAK